jgi:hypothetical protein
VLRHDAVYVELMDRSSLDDLQKIVDHHARRVAREVGGLLVDVGEALRRTAETTGRSDAPPPRTPPEATREELLQEAARLGIKGRSRMSKDELRAAIDRLK